MELIPAVVMTTDVIVHPHIYEFQSIDDWSWDKDTREKANGLVSSIRRFENIVSFVVQKNSLHPLKGIAAKLQKRDLDIFDAFQKIEETIACLRGYRTNVEEFHSRCYVESKLVAEEIGSVKEQPRTVQRQNHREEYFKRNITISFLYFLVSEMETRFSEQNRGAIVGIFSLIPKVAVVKQPNIHDLSYYKDDLLSFSSLEAEVEHWCFQWKTRASISTPLPDNLICSRPHAHADKFSNIRVLIEIGCIFPVSSSEAERSFSVLRRLKTHLRNRMGEDRLAALKLLNINSNLDIDPKEIMARLTKKNPRRLFRSLYND